MANYEIPDECRYTREDEWVRVEDDLLVIGVSDYAQQQMGDVVFVELPSPGTEISEGQTFGVIESVKAVSDLYAPISGEVAESNEDLAERPEAVNESCYEDGWMIKVRNFDASVIEGMMDAPAYQEFLDERDD